MEFYVYLWKSTAILSLFFLVDFFLLKKETLFKQNRYFLLAGVICALVFPLIEFTQVTYIERASTPFNFGDIPITTYNSEEPEPFNWWQLLFYIYIAGVIVMLIRFSVQIIGLMKILNKPKYKDTDGFYHIELHEKISPFSFFKYIAYYLKSYNREELDFIIQHEKIHGRQYHSIDVLLNQFLLIVFWFNPLAWGYQKRILENLEFIADHEVANESNLQQKNYELTLLKVSTNYEAPSLANQFYQSLIKKRIVMLNKKPSQKTVFFKSLIILPLLGVFLWSFNVNEEVEYLPAKNSIISQEIPQDSVIVNSKISISEISLIYDKNTTEKQLAEDQKFFKDEFGIKLKYSKLKFNKNNELTRLKLSIEDADGFSKTVYSGKNGEFKEVYFYKNFESGETKFELSDHAVENKPYGTSDLYEVINDSGIIILNGKKENLNQLKNTIILVETTTQENGLAHIKGQQINNIADEMKGEQPKTFIKINEKAKANIIRFSGIKVSSYSDEKFSDQEIIKKAENIHATGSPQENEQIANSIGYQQKDPLILIDGKEATQEEMKNLEPSLIKSVNILKGENATEKYGEKGKNGVIEITLKTEEEIKAEKEKKDNSPKPDLILLDGKEIDKEDFSNLDHKIIKSMEVFKDKKAIKKFGEKAKNGVVIITMKTEEELKAEKEKRSKKTAPDYAFAINGKLVAKSEAEALKPTDIESTNIITVEDSEEFRGKTDKKKVMNIILKEKDDATPEQK